MLTVDPALVGRLEGSRLLDLGCGGGRHAYAFLKLGAEVVALDASLSEPPTVAGMIAAMREAGELDSSARAGVLSADALALPFAAGSFDTVVASEVLEHLLEDRSAIGEIVRVLRPGGRLAVSVPRALPERINWTLSREYHSNPGGHVRIYRRRQLVERLEDAGLRVLCTRYRHGLHSPYWWLRCAVGVGRAEHPLVAAYHRLLVWDIVARPRLTRAAEWLLDPLIGKSLVVYLELPLPA